MKKSSEKYNLKRIFSIFILVFVIILITGFFEKTSFYSSPLNGKTIAKNIGMFYSGGIYGTESTTTYSSNYLSVNYNGYNFINLTSVSTDGNNAYLRENGLSFTLTPKQGQIISSIYTSPFNPNIKYVLRDAKIESNGFYNATVLVGFQKRFDSLNVTQDSVVVDGINYTIELQNIDSGYATIRVYDSTKSSTSGINRNAYPFPYISFYSFNNVYVFPSNTFSNNQHYGADLLVLFEKSLYSGICTDSDGGKNYGLKGSTQIPSIVNVDYCETSLGNNVLREYYCDIDGTSDNETYTCPSGNICQDGACVANSTNGLNYFIAYDNNAPVTDVVQAFLIQRKIKEELGVNFISVSNTDQKQFDLQKSFGIYFYNNKSLIITRTYLSDSEISLQSDISSILANNNLGEYKTIFATQLDSQDVVSSINKFFPTAPPAPGKACTDTDGGKDYYVKGQIKDNNGIKVDEDECHPYGSPNPYVLFEYFCYANGSIGEVDFNCPSGSCYAGACVVNGSYPSICSEDWLCEDWGSCSKSGTQSRTCYDMNHCGTYKDKPSTNQFCIPGKCSENWNCTSWSDCTNSQQTRTCTDLNHCTTSLNEPKITQTCGQSTFMKFYINGKEVIIEKTLEGKYLIKYDKGIIETSMDIDNNTQDLSIKTSAGWDKQIKYVPDPDLVNISKIISQDEKVEIMEKDGEAVYSITGTKKGRLLGIFPVYAHVEQKINIETGKIVETNKPWWSFLAGI